MFQFLRDPTTPIVLSLLSFLMSVYGIIYTHRRAPAVHLDYEFLSEVPSDTDIGTPPDNLHPWLLIRVISNGEISPLSLTVKGYHCRTGLYIDGEYREQAFSVDFARTDVHIAVFGADMIGRPHDDRRILIEWQSPPAKHPGTGFQILTANGYPPKLTGVRKLLAPIRYLDTRRYWYLFNHMDESALAYHGLSLEGMITWHGKDPLKNARKSSHRPRF